MSDLFAAAEEEQLRQHYSRLETFTVDANPTGPAEPGAHQEARQLAHELCTLVNGTQWTATLRAQYERHPRVDTVQDTTITVDQHSTFTVSYLSPAGTIYDFWQLSVNGSPIPHRVLAREIPHARAAIVRSFWRHLHNIHVDPCDSLGCDEPPTIAIYGGSVCPRCASRNAGTRLNILAPTTATR